MDVHRRPLHREEHELGAQDLVRRRVDAHLGAGPFEGDLGARIEELARRASAVFETALPFLRAVEPDRQRSRGDRARRILDLRIRCQIEEALAPELAEHSEGTVDLLAAILSVGAWDHMRNAQGHDAERAVGLLESAVLRLMGGAGSRSEQDSK